MLGSAAPLKGEPIAGKYTAMPSLNMQPTIEKGAPPIPRDLKHVSLKEDVEVQYWSRRFQASRRLLEEAVEQVGHSVNAVADYLGRNR